MGRAFNIFTAGFAALGSFLFGYDSGIISSVLQVPAFIDKFHASPSMNGAIVSTFAGGCFFGAAGAGWASDKLGRKRTIQIGCVWALAGCALQTGAHKVSELLIGRVIAGVAIGILSMVVPLYNAEISPPKIRGFIVGLAQLQISFGFIAAQWVGYGCQFFDDDRQWRVPLGLQMAPALLLLIGIQFLPFSPRWLIEQGREDEAQAALIRLYSSSGSSRDVAEKEFAEMRDTIRAELLTRTRHISDLYSTASMRRRTLIASGVQIFTQFTGINVISYFGPLMYKALGIANNKLLLVQGIYGAVGFISNAFFVVFIVDSVGRKKPLLFGALMIAILFATLSAIVASFPPGDQTTSNPAAQRAGIAMIFMVSITFSASFGPVSWVLSSEVFPTRTRSLGTAVSTCSNWAFNVLLSQVSPIALADVGWKFYMLFVALNTVDFVIILIFFPETKGKTLEEMAVLFGDKLDDRLVLEQHGEHAVSQELGRISSLAKEEDAEKGSLEKE